MDEFNKASVGERIDGDKCCFAVSLNRTTGECEKCFIGYHGTDCAKKCVYPTCGEDCQSRCRCSNETCHFSCGCLPNTGTVTGFNKKVFGEYRDFVSTRHRRFVNKYS